MKLLEKGEQKSIEFWEDIGSGIPKHKGQDWEEWAKDVCRTAWHNGFYHGRFTIGYADMMEQDTRDERRICENCKHWKNDDLGKWCGLSSEEMGEKDFCSKFEVKENK